MSIYRGTDGTIKCRFGPSRKLRESIDALETGGSIPVSKRPFLVGGQMSGPAIVPSKWAEVLHKQIHYNYAIICYKMRHGKLPASDRTKRLRKKRRSIIMKWRYGK